MREMDIGGWVAIVTTVILGAIAWGEVRTRVSTNSTNIKELWEKKADGESFRELRTKTEGIDHWTREHDTQAGSFRLENAQKLAGMEKAIEIGMHNHAELVRVAGRLEASIEKMENKFDELTKRMEDALSRRRGSDHA